MRNLPGLLRELVCSREQDDNELFGKMCLRPGASGRAVEEFRARTAFSFPEDYLELLRIADGIHNLELDVTLFGTSDRPDSPEVAGALEVLELVGRVSEMFYDGASVEDFSCFFPIGGGPMGSYFQLYAVDLARLPLPGPIVAIFHSETVCFPDMAAVIEWIIDPFGASDAGRCIDLPVPPPGRLEQ